MKLDSLNNIDLDMKVLVIGDCATNHIEKYTGLDNIISRQIQGGLGAEKEIANINKPSAIMLFVSWANALSVITDEGDPDNLEPVDINEIIRIAGEAEPKMITLFKKLIKQL